MRAFLLPEMTPATAERWVRRGATWALLIGLLDLLIWAAVSRNDPESVFRGVQLIDALLTLLLAGGVWLRSRIAASGLLAYWVYSKVHQLATTGHVVSPVLGLLIFGWVFLNTLRAAIALHRGTPATGGENAAAI
jgi:hypothetical protein